MVGWSGRKSGQVRRGHDGRVGVNVRLAREEQYLERVPVGNAWCI